MHSRKHNKQDREREREIKQSTNEWNQIEKDKMKNIQIDKNMGRTKEWVG